MKRNLLFSMSILLMTVHTLNAQVLYTDDFESYNIGDGIALQSTWWDTWTSSPGTSEDPVVSDAFALSGTQSVKVSGSNDGVIVFNELDTNRYRIEFYIYIPTGRQAYYNLMQKFDPIVAANNIWGMQIFFQNGTVSIDGGAASAASFAYQSDTWIKMQHFVDMDNDWVDIYVNDTLVHAYQWSHGTFNDGSGINQLDAVNFYAWNQGGTPEYYVDDMIIEHVPSPESAQNFALQIINLNDVELTWNSPPNDTAESYAIVRDGQIIATVTDDSTYIDLNLYPGTYTYQLLAYYGNNLGYSPSAGTLDAYIPGGNQRELVLFEIFTGTWCSYCPTAAQAITQMENLGRDIAVIEYHGGDSYETPVTAARASYYSPIFFGGNSFGYPGSIINGMYGFAGALPNVTQHRQLYEYYYEEYLSIPTVFTIDANVTDISGFPYTFTVDVAVEETFHYFNDEMRLMVALTETDIPQNWMGLTQVKNVLRKMYPNANGTILDFSVGSTVNHTFSIELEANYNPAKTHAVIFVQNRITGQVMETIFIDLGALVSGIEEPSNATVAIYPNPAGDFVIIDADERISYIEITDITGRFIEKQAVDNNSKRINVKSLSDGIYLIKVYTETGISMHKIIKQ